MKRYCRYCREQREHGWDDCPFRLEALERMRRDREQGDLHTSTVDGARGFVESYGG